MQLLLGLALCAVASSLTFDIKNWEQQTQLRLSSSTGDGAEEALFQENSTDIGGPGSAAASSNFSLVLTEEGSQPDQTGIYVWVKDTVKLVIGCSLILLSVSALWFFERQNARFDCLFSSARSSCVSASGLQALPEHDGRLVHVAGAAPRPVTLVRDPRFCDVVLQEGCLRLRTRVQVYGAQRSRARGPVGESEFGWSEVDDTPILQERQKSGGRPSTPPHGLRLGTTVTNCGHVELGDSFKLPDALVDQCRSFQPAEHLLGPLVTTADGKLTFRKHSNGCFYYRPGTPAWSPSDVAEAPLPGDVQVRFEYVPPGPVTVLALQAGSSKEEASFFPFRLVPRGLFGLSEEQERAALIAQARKTRERLAQEDQCMPGTRLCFGCNLIAGACSGILTPEVFSLFPGIRSVDECFRELVNSSRNLWLIRFVLLFAMVGGLSLFSFAVSVAAPHLEDMPVFQVSGHWARPVLSMAGAFLVDATIIAVAYFPFRPLSAACCLGFVLAAVVIPNVMIAPSGGRIMLHPLPDMRPNVTLIRLLFPGPKIVPAA